MKKLLFFGLLIALLLSQYKKLPDKSVHLIICDVGQGDAILIQQGYWQLLIDTGPDESVLACLNRHLPPLDKEIDLLLITHYDHDHLGGALAVTDAYHIAHLFAPLSDSKDSQLFLEWESRLRDLIEQGTIINQPILGQQMAYQHFSLEYNSPSLLLTLLSPTHLEWQAQAILNPFQMGSRSPETQLSALEAVREGKIERPESTNDRSIALLMEYGQLRVFLSGDLEEETELSMLDSALITRVDILKVAHHGSKTSSSQQFLSRVRPETALISVGENNSFGHPSPEVLERLASFARQIYRSDRDGEVELQLFKDHFQILQ